MIRFTPTIKCWFSRVQFKRRRWRCYFWRGVIRDDFSIF